MVPFLIFFTLLIAMLFLASIIFLISFIVFSIKKNQEKIKKFRLLFIIFFALSLILSGLDIYLIISYIYNNRNVIIEKTIEKSSDIISDSLAQTVSGFEKNWDKTLLKKFENLDITLVSSNQKVKDKKIIYTLELLFNNTNPDNAKIYFHDLLENNYLVACDKDDVVFIMKAIEYNSDKIPVGKTKGTFEVELKKDDNLTYIRFVHKKIMIENG
jgi:hypothetical protein